MPNLTEKRKIILTNFTNPTKQIELTKLEKISQQLTTPFFTFRSLEGNCGDVIHILLQIEKKHLKEIYFSAQQSCLITVAAANILTSYLEKKNLATAGEIINNFRLLVAGKEYNLDNYSDLQVFSDISNFPHRVECLKLAIRGISETLKRMTKQKKF